MRKVSAKLDGEERPTTHAFMTPVLTAPCERKEKGRWIHPEREKTFSFMISVVV